MSNTVSQPHTSDLAAVAQPALAVERYMARFLEERRLTTNLHAAICYALLGSGKRLRPTLVIRACEAVGGQAEQALAAAAAIEMVHCFSLVHDDLPAMDDDDLRRGRPTLHKHAGEAMAILAGDAMLGLSFELIATRMRPDGLANKIMAELAIATNQMIVGQVYDTLTESEPDSDPAQTLATIHRHKTGALIRCSGRMGALCGRASELQMRAITEYAEAIGLMFQIVDDLLDVTQTTEQLGKAANKDRDKGKLTYPGLLGIEPSRVEVTRLRDKAHLALVPLGDPAEPLHELCDYLAVRQR